MVFNIIFFFRLLGVYVYCFEIYMGFYMIYFGGYIIKRDKNDVDV